MQLKNLILLSLWAGLFQVCAAQDAAQNVERLVQSFVDADQFNGSVLLAKGDKVVYQNAYGLADHEWQIENTLDTKFRLASVTKQFTGMLIVMLVQEGKIDLDQKITTYLPNYRKETGDRINVHQLLQHSSGIPNCTANPLFQSQYVKSDIKMDDFIKELCSDDLEFEPGSEFNYSNSGYILLGSIVESVTGVSYAEALQKMIFDPLGMTNSGYDTHEQILPKRAKGYEQGPSGLQNAPYINMEIPHAAGAMYSTVGDLLKWANAWKTNQLLDDKHKEIYFTPGHNDYACGIGVMKGEKLEGIEEPLTLRAHSGGIEGFGTFIVNIPEQDLTVIALDNHSSDPSEMAQQCVMAYNGLEVTGPKKSIMLEMGEIVQEQDLDAALEFFAAEKNNDKSSFDTNPNVLNNLGYHFLYEEGNKRDAIKVFLLNVELFPEVANTYDSLGEAYMEDKQWDLAVKNYQKTVEMEPENKNAKTMLKKIKQMRK